MTITILSVGARPNAETAAFIVEYVKRLPKHIRVNWHFLKHGVGQPELMKSQEAELILKNIPKGALLIVLDERGKQYSSLQFSELVFNRSVDLCFVIGGAYGVHSSIIEKAGVLWSLGALVYPHQMVRIILAEQLYRAYSISVGSPYHHQ
jgi:23S rRNA (pseudouridine1915-N3)-methyltransferase